jgi:excisionase family DNA binding protein
MTMTNNLQPESSPQVRLLSKKEVAERLGVSERTIHELIKNGKLNTVPIGRLVKIDINDLADFIAAQKRTPPPLALAR